MLKRLIAVLLTVVISMHSFVLIGYGQVVSFLDFNQSHWAYTSVMTLVADGTISGYVDGEFKPQNQVSRAEFVKMIGKSNVKRETDFEDVAAEHWGYSYIMYSGLKALDGNRFAPSTPITRAHVIELIWERAGSKKDAIAPSIITNQGANRDAVAWAYTYGLIKGNDGLNLRLNDPLSRAEAATLIVRARSISDSTTKVNFIDAVSPKLLETIFNSIKVFDNVPYQESKTISNGEMCKAAIRLGSEEVNLTYMKYVTGKLFEHKYAIDLYIMGNACLGKENITQEFIDQEANVKNTLTAFVYNAINKAHTPLKYGQKGMSHSDVGLIGNDMMDICLTFANQNGIQLYADGTIKPNQAITHKELAAILLQLDSIVGTQSSVVIGDIGTNERFVDQQLQKNMERYSSNAADFQCILQDVPTEVYAKPFLHNQNMIIRRPKQSYDFCREYGFILVQMLQEFRNKIESNNQLKIKITYYPSLVCNNGDGFVMRVKFDIMENNAQGNMDEVFNGIVDSKLLQKGSSFYGDIITGQPVSDIYLSSSAAKLVQIITCE